MIEAYMNWKPNKWSAGVLSMIAPPLGFLYANRGRSAAIYLAFLVGLTLLQYFLYVQGFEVPLTLFLTVVAVFQAYRIAARTEPTNVRRWYSRWFGLFGLIGTTVLMLVLFRAMLYEPFRLPAQSMYPTIPQGTNLIVQKFGYGNYEAYGVRFARVPVSAPVARGDLLVFEYPKDRSMKYIKRVIGLPGDHVVYRDKRLFINGTPATIGTPLERDNFEIVTESLGQGIKYAVANDRRAPVKDFDVIVSDEALFFLGDNRDNSLDSRYWGSAPYDHIVGKVVHMFIPKDAQLDVPVGRP